MNGLPKITKASVSRFADGLSETKVAASAFLGSLAAAKLGILSSAGLSFSEISSIAILNSAITAFSALAVMCPIDSLFRLAAAAANRREYRVRQQLSPLSSNIYVLGRTLGVLGGLAAGACVANYVYDESTTRMVFATVFKHNADDNRTAAPAPIGGKDIKFTIRPSANPI